VKPHSQDASANGADIESNAASKIMVQDETKKKSLAMTVVITPMSGKPKAVYQAGWES
jgi:hypothetical protein